MVSISLAPSSPARAAKFRPSARPWSNAGDADLVDHLGELARAMGAHQHAGPGIGIDHRLGAVEGGLLAADHHRQLAVLGAGLAAGDRRVEEIDARLLGLLGDLAGELGRGRRVVDQHRALAHAREHARRRHRARCAHRASLPTQTKTKSAPLRRLGGRGRRAGRLCWATQASARAAVRLKTVTSWPLALRCPAMG